MNNITDTDYTHTKRVCKDFEIKNFAEYHMYVPSDTFLLLAVFNSFQNRYFKIHQLDPAHFLSAPGLVWQADFKQTKVELNLLTDIDTLLMVEKGIRYGKCHAIHQYVKANNKFMTYYNKKKSSHFNCQDASNLYGW